MRAHSGVLEVQLQGCRAIRGLVKNRVDYQAEIARLGGTDAVQQALQRHGAHSAPLAEEAMWTMQKLSMAEECQHKFVPAGGVELVARMMADAMRDHPHDRGVQEGAILALNNTACSTALLQRIKELGGQTLIRHATETHRSLKEDGAAEEILNALADLP